MTDTITQIRVLAEEHTMRHNAAPTTMTLGNAEAEALEDWCGQQPWYTIKDPTLEGDHVEFMGMRVVRSGRARGIGFE